MLSKTRFQTLLHMTRKQERAAAGMFFVEGWRWLEEALALPTPPEWVVFTPEAGRTPAEKALLERARATARESAEVTPEQLARLTANVTAPGVAALVRWIARTGDDFTRLVPATGATLAVALDAVADPGNAGTIVRTADWFGAQAVVFGPGAVDPTNPKTVRATMGSLFHLPVVETASLVAIIAQARAGGLAAIGAALDGEELPAFAWPERVLLVLGNEANGIGPEVAAALDRRVRIPNYGKAESLNAAVAAAVLMADWRRVHARTG